MALFSPVILPFAPNIIELLSVSYLSFNAKKLTEISSLLTCEVATPALKPLNI